MSEETVHFAFQLQIITVVVVHKCCISSLSCHIQTSSRGESIPSPFLTTFRKKYKFKLGGILVTGAKAKNH